jgi:hypothetical protein
VCGSAQQWSLIRLESAKPTYAATNGLPVNLGFRPSGLGQVTLTIYFLVGPSSSPIAIQSMLLPEYAFSLKSNSSVGTL